jgi:hypothetical protein
MPSHSQRLVPKDEGNLKNLKKKYFLLPYGTFFWVERFYHEKAPEK